MNSAKKIVHEVVKHLDEDKQHQLLDWAENANKIAQRTDISKGAKLRLLRDLETVPAVSSLILGFCSEAKLHLWDRRSGAARGALSGVLLGVLTLGGQSAGIAALGGAIGLPLFVLTAAGGSLLGTIISEINSELAKKD